jgi:hypothetical protein
VSLRSQREPPAEYKEDPELQSLRQQLFGNPDLTAVETPQLNRLLPSLREYAHQQGANGNYDEAQCSWTLAEDVYRELKKRNGAYDIDEHAFSSEHQDFEDKAQAQFDEFDRDSESRLAALAAQHEREREAFERTWAESMPRRYRKPSAQLLQLKRIEKSHALSADFEHAKQVHAEAERLAAAEQIQQQENLIRDYQVAANRLKTRQDWEIANLRETREHERSIMQEKYERAMIAINNRVFVVDTKRKETQKGYRSLSRERSTIETEANPFSGDRSGIEDVLLGPLRPPNDPALVEAERQRKRELDRKKFEFQKQNARVTLAKYSVIGEEFEEEEEEKEAEAVEPEVKVEAVRRVTAVKSALPVILPASSGKIDKIAGSQSVGFPIKG